MVLANGTDDALKVICETFIDPGDLLLIPVPTFPVYKFFASVQGACAVEVRYDENFNLPMDRFMAALKRKPRWVAIANPNNPTGTIVSRKDLRAILRAAPHTLVLVDEAYYDFSGQTVLPWIPKYPNLIVTRTFSKAFGLAALRMGCIFANRQLAETMRRGMNPFSVNALALACAVEATKQGGYVKRYVAEILANRAKFLPRSRQDGYFLCAQFGEFRSDPDGRRKPGNRSSAEAEKYPGSRLELRIKSAGLSPL